MLKLKDPISAITHIIGAILSVIALAILVVYSTKHGDMCNVISCIVFGISLILLYTCSSLYHSINISEKVTNILKKLDHIMIFILIAGTYTPIVLGPLRGPWGWTIFGITWGLALIGTLITAITLKAPRWLSTSIYVLMGWIVLIAIVPMVNTFTLESLAWLLAGGIMYTVGAVIYAIKKPNFKYFGFHEVFHIFILLGSFLHFMFIILYCI